MAIFITAFLLYFAFLSKLFLCQMEGEAFSLQQNYWKFKAFFSLAKLLEEILIEILTHS